MYIPSLLAEERPHVVRSLLRQNPLGALVTSGRSGLEANHFPFEFDESLSVIRTHLSQANPLWSPGADHTEALVIFQGPNHYISPGWQPGRAQSGRVAPSWNYVVVHVYGTLTFVENPVLMRGHLEALTMAQESRFADPWSLDEAPAGFLETLAQRIVGIEIRVTQIAAKAQACQQYSVATREGVITGLHTLGTANALEMARVIHSASDRS